MDRINIVFSPSNYVTAVVVNLAAVALMVSLVLIGSTGAMGGLEWMSVGIVAIVLVIADLMILPALFVHYVEIGKSDFVIHLGFYHMLIRYDDITSITERIPDNTHLRRKPTAADYLYIESRHGEEVLSLADEAAFLEVCKAHNPAITIETTRA